MIAASNVDHTGWRSRGYLAHLDAPDLVQHVAFRLVDSLPAGLRDENRRVSRDGSADAVDATLDRGYGRHDLAIPEIGEVTQNALLNSIASGMR